jgi:hypothetical protein
MGNGSSANKQPAPTTHHLSWAKWNQLQPQNLLQKKTKLTKVTDDLPRVAFGLWPNLCALAPLWLNLNASLDDSGWFKSANCHTDRTRKYPGIDRRENAALPTGCPMAWWKFPALVDRLRSG